MDDLSSRFYDLPDGRRTVREVGAPALRELLQGLENRIRAAGFDFDAYFRTGLSRDTVLESFQRVGLTPPEEVIALYSWRNGYTTAGGLHWPIPDMTFAPLERVLARYEHRGGLVGSPLEVTAPFIILEADIRGRAVLCDGPPSEPPSVLYFDEDNRIDERTEPIGRSICTWVTSWILSIDMGRVRPVGSPADRQWYRDITVAPKYFETLALD